MKGHTAMKRCPATTGKWSRQGSKNIKASGARSIKHLAVAMARARQTPVVQRKRAKGKP